MADRQRDFSFCRAEGERFTETPRDLPPRLPYGPLTYGQWYAARRYGIPSLVSANNVTLMASDASAPVSLPPGEQWSHSPWAAAGLDETSEYRPWPGHTSHNVVLSKIDDGYASTINVAASTDCPTVDAVQLPGLKALSPTVRYAGDQVASVPTYPNSYGPGEFCSKTMRHLSELGLETPATLYEAAQRGKVTSDMYSQQSLHDYRSDSHHSGQSNSDHQIALWRTWRSSYLMNTIVNTPTLTSQGSASDISSDINSEAMDPSDQMYSVKPAECTCHDRTHDRQTTIDEFNGNVEHANNPSSPISSPFSTSDTTIAIDGDSVHQSTDDRHSPNRFASLAEPPLILSQPSALTPCFQSPRFPGDLYNPSYTRKFGNQREGWCGLCRPGRWLALKTSAFWYDKSFTHGISAASGRFYDGPGEIRKGRRAGVSEGLCGTCGAWIALVVSKKGGLSWFRHAYKCHEHTRISKASRKRRHGASPRNANTAGPVAAHEKQAAIESGTVMH